MQKNDPLRVVAEAKATPVRTSALARLNARARGKTPKLATETERAAQPGPRQKPLIW